MKKGIFFLALAGLFFDMKVKANDQDTFSIVGLDTITGEVGSAGASCVDLIAFNIADASFLGDLLPGKGAINTQASYLAANQNNARNRMNTGDTPSQIITWLQSNDAGSDPTVRQYGIAEMIGGTPYTAGFTGTNCLSYKNHIAGRNYCIQGNILLGQQVLDSMESKFNGTPGTLACKLMAALQGAKMVGADTRCSSNNSSSLFAFLKVAKPNDTYGNPYISISVKTPTNSFKEPIDSLQTIANSINLCSITTALEDNRLENRIGIFPNPATNSFSILNYSPYKISKISISNAMGQKVMFIESPSEQKNISILSLKSGIYFITISFSDLPDKQILRLVKE